MFYRKNVKDYPRYEKKDVELGTLQSKIDVEVSNIKIHKEKLERRMQNHAQEYLNNIFKTYSDEK